MVYQYISSRQIASEWFTRTRSTDTNVWHNMPDYIGEALNLIKAPACFFFQIEKFQVKDKQLTLPCGIKKIDQVSRGGQILSRLNATFLNDTRLGFRENGNRLVFNFRQGEIEMRYTAALLDEEGFPLVPDDPAFNLALFYYIEKNYRYPDYIAGRIAPAIYQDIETQWQWYCGQAYAVSVAPGLSQIEAAKDSWLRLRTQPHHAKNGFKDLSTPEQFDRS